MSTPSIPVSEVSRILVNIRKNCKNFADKNGYTALDSAYFTAIKDIRKALELRRRSRVQKNIRGNGKMDRSAK